MSTIEGVGIRRDLDGPQPVAPPHSLLQTPGVLAGVDNRVFNGVNLIGYPDDTPSIWEPCQDGTFDVKAEGTGRPEGQFDPFVVYLPVTCSTYGARGLDEQAQKVIEATQSMGVEEYLAIGGPSGNAPNPFFGDANVVELNSGAAVSPRVGLSYLEDYIGQQSGRQGMIHATPAVVAALDAFADLPGALVTINGTPVVSGDGYIGVDTPWLTDPSYSLTAGNTEQWVFATGPVRVYLGPVVVQPLREALDRSDNTVTFRAERWVLAVWDTAVQGAVLVDWST